MPIDPEISLGVQQPPNPLATAASALQLQGMMNRNQLFQLQTQGQLAVGNIIAQHTDPETGFIDMKGVRAATATNPQAAYNMPTWIKSFADQQISQLDAATKTQAFTSAALDIHRQFMQTVYHDAGGVNISKDKIFAATMDAIHQYDTNPNIPDDLRKQLRTNLLTKVNEMPDKGPALDARVRQLVLEGLPQEKQAEMTIGKPIPIQVGDKTLLLGFDQTTNEIKNLGYATHGLTPDQATSPVEGAGGVQVPRNQTTLGGPRSGLFDPSGNPLVGVGGRQGGMSLSPGGEGTQPPGAMQPPGAPQPPGGLAVGGQGAPNPIIGATAPPTRGASGAGPVQPQSIFEKSQTAAGGEYVSALNERVRTGGDIQKQLGEVIPLLDKMRAGGGAEIRTNLARIGQGLGMPDSWVQKIQGGDQSGALAAAQEFEKFMVQLSTQSLRQAFTGAVGKYTNLEWDAFQKANPNIELDPEASKKIFAFSTRMYNIDKSEQDALAKARQDPKFNVNTWQSHWQDELVKRKLIDPAALEKTLGAPSVAPSSPAPSQGTVKFKRNPDGSLTKVQ